MTQGKLILGEYRRVVDDRFRLSIPAELMDQGTSETITPFGPEDEGATASPGSGTGRTTATDQPAASSDQPEWVLAKERPGCLSLWQQANWQDRLESGVRVVQSKLAAGRLGDRLTQVQTLGRLLSTRQRPVQLAGRGRLLIPEGFREFLGVEPGMEVLVIGAAVCIEIWHLKAWKDCLSDDIPRFGDLLDDLSR